MISSVRMLFEYVQNIETREKKKVFTASIERLRVLLAVCYSFETTKITCLCRISVPLFSLIHYGDVISKHASSQGLAVHR